MTSYSVYIFSAGNATYLTLVRPGIQTNQAVNISDMNQSNSFTRKTTLKYVMVCAIMAIPGVVLGDAYISSE